MPPLIAFAGALGGLAVVRWAYKTAVRINRNWKKRAWRASPKLPGQAIFRPCAGTPSPAPIARANDLIQSGQARVSRMAANRGLMDSRRQDALLTVRNGPASP